MANHFIRMIVVLFSVAAICSSSFAESSNSPFIVAHKRISQKRVNPDLERLSVSIDIYNTGSEAAYDVTLTDDDWDKDVFENILGNTSATWERLNAGALVSHSFELESKVKTIYHGVPALITYRIPTNIKLQEAYSTPILPVTLLAETDPRSKLEIAKKLYVEYSQHAAVILLVAFFVHVLMVPSKSANAKKKRH